MSYFGLLSVAAPYSIKPFDIVKIRQHAYLAFGDFAETQFIGNRLYIIARNGIDRSPPGDTKNF
jgi:hypothetical protein